MAKAQIDQPIEPTDADLVKHALAHGQSAIRAIIQKFNRRLYRLARSIVNDDAEAEDVLQEAYLRAFAALPGFRGEATLATWLSRIVINEAIQQNRRRQSRPHESWAVERHAEVIAFPNRNALPDPEVTMAQREVCNLVERAIDDLPVDFRMVLVARTIEGMSIEDTADALGLKPETVKTRLHRARRLLKQALDEHLEAQFGNAFPFDGRRCQRIADAVLARIGRGNLSP